MTLITFPDADRFQFCVAIVKPGTNLFAATQLYPDRHAVEVDHPILGHLLERLAAGQPIVLPYANAIKGQRHWLLAATGARDLDRLLRRVTTFVVPTYARFAGSPNLPQRQAFRNDGPPLQRLGAKLYPAGYYGLRARPASPKRSCGDSTFG